MLKCSYCADQVRPRNAVRAFQVGQTKPDDRVYCSHECYMEHDEIESQAKEERNRLAAKARSRAFYEKKKREANGH